MKLEDEIKQEKFKNVYQKAVLNILFTASWINNLNISFLKPFRISPQQFNVLRILRGQFPKPATINLLQERMLDRTSNASRLVEKLRRKSLIRRSQSGKDRRQVDVLITSKGLNLLKKIDDKIGNIEIYFEKISPQEAESINIILDKMRGK